MGEALAGRRRWVWAAAAVVVLALAAFGVVRAVTADATEKPRAAETVTVDRGPVTAEVATTGTVQPAQTRNLSFAVAAVVESVSVRPGTTVTPGQVLAKVDDSDAAAAVDEAQDALDDAQAALTKAKEADKKQLDCRTQEATHPALTAKTSATAKTTPNANATPTKGARSTTPSKGAMSTTPNQGTRSATPAQATCPPQSRPGGDAILTAEQRVTQATTKLGQAEDALDGATITAPIAGRVLSVAGQVGTRVGAGSTFVTLADVNDMQVSAAFPEADADSLADGQKAVVTLADRAGAEFAATVVQVDPVGVSDGTMVRYGVVLSFVKAPKDLLVGQSAEVRVTTGAKAEVLRVPSTAVHDVAGRTGTVLRGGTRTRIGVGLRGDAFTEVTTGLGEGDQIVRSW